ARTPPLVPACGVLVAVAGLLLKAGPSSDGIAEVFLGFAVLFAVLGLSFLARGHFIYAGRRTIGLSPTVDDIAFARDRLVRKQACTRRGGWLAAIAPGCLVGGILVGVQIPLGPGGSRSRGAVSNGAKEPQGFPQTEWRSSDSGSASAPIW